MLENDVRGRRRPLSKPPARGGDRPEALLLRPARGMSAADILVALIALIILAMLLSRLLYRLNMRDRPY